MQPWELWSVILIVVVQAAMSDPVFIAPKGVMKIGFSR